MMEQPKGPFCQSCAMPMEKPGDFGTNADESKNGDYCHFCFQDGSFTDPDITLEQMMEKVAGIMTEQMKMPEAQVREITGAFIPKLKRWQS